MHVQVYEFVETQLAEHGPFRRVLEIGSRDINGTIRGLFRAEEYIGVDISAGPGVDRVIDAADYRGTGFDCVVCCEVFEHAKNWRSLCATALHALKPGGLFLASCATSKRAPHGVHGGELPAPGEHYEGVDDPSQALLGFSHSKVWMERDGLDLRIVAFR